MLQMNNSYHGVMVPMVTPFLENGLIDESSAGKLINFLLDNETTPFILGTTGECTSIPTKERDVLVKMLLSLRRDKKPFIAGVNGLTFKETVLEANKYLDWGIDAVVLTLPAYYDLSDDQIFHFFNDLAAQIQGDIILYNIPKVVNMSIPLDVVERLSHKKNIIGIKDSEMNEKRLEKSLQLWAMRKDFFHLVGVNKLMIRGLQLGSKGIIPSSGNIQPRLYKIIYESCIAGDVTKAEEAFHETEKLSILYQNGKMLGESLAALKCILAVEGLCKPFVSKPLTNLSGQECIEIKNNYRKFLNHA